eukprot:902388-Pyramimonas_sp.AAC.1
MFLAVVYTCTAYVVGHALLYYCTTGAQLNRHSGLHYIPGNVKASPQMQMQTVFRGLAVCNPHQQYDLTCCYGSSCAPVTARVHTTPQMYRYAILVINASPHGALAWRWGLPMCALTRKRKCASWSETANVALRGRSDDSAPTWFWCTCEKGRPRSVWEAKPLHSDHTVFHVANSSSTPRKVIECSFCIDQYGACRTRRCEQDGASGASEAGKHSGNIQGTFREHSGNIRGEHSGNIRGTFREHSGNIQGTFKEQGVLEPTLEHPKALVLAVLVDQSTKLNFHRFRLFHVLLQPAGGHSGGAERIVPGISLGDKGRLSKRRVSTTRLGVQTTTSGRVRVLHRLSAKNRRSHGEGP